MLPTTRGAVDRARGDGAWHECRSRARLIACVADVQLTGRVAFPPFGATLTSSGDLGAADLVDAPRDRVVVVADLYGLDRG